MQCKQWKKWNVGVKAVRELLGAMTGAKVHKGVFDAVDARYDPMVQAVLQDTRKLCPKSEKEMVHRW